MRKRFSRVSRWTAGAALVAMLALSATPAMADQGRGRGRKPIDRREYRQDQRRDSYRDNHGQQQRWGHPGGRAHVRHVAPDRCRPRVIVTPRVIVRPQVVYRYEPVRHRTLPYPVWCAAPSRVTYHGDEPFFFNASLGVFLSGAQIWVQVGNAPPPGYGYYDPYCNETFYSAAEYRWHCNHRHDPLLVVVSLEDQGPYDDVDYHGGCGR